MKRGGKKGREEGEEGEVRRNVKKGEVRREVKKGGEEGRWRIIQQTKLIQRVALNL